MYNTIGSNLILANIDFMNLAIGNGNYINFLILLLIHLMESTSYCGNSISKAEIENKHRQEKFKRLTQNRNRNVNA